MVKTLERGAPEQYKYCLSRDIWGLMRFRWRWQQRSFVAIIVLWGLFKLNLLSTGWNILVGLVVTAILFVLVGFIGND
jgi:hypothetical protein